MVSQPALVLFSDIDGTLVHYTKLAEGSEFDAHGRVHLTSPGGTEVVGLPLPVSSTGKRGWVSAGTLAAVDAIRAAGVPFVLISGARTSTVLSRLPHLPRADAVVTENGGRVFYPPPQGGADEWREDMEWRERHASIAGAAPSGAVPPAERAGLLWDVYREFVAAGFAVDTTSYETCFRVTPGSATAAALTAAVRSLPPGLTSTDNLGMADVYPSTSGKANAGRYLAKRFGATMASAAFLCDDDNDIELALACGRAYLPTISSGTMREAVAENSGHYFVASEPHMFGTEQALRELMKDWNIQEAPAGAPEPGDLPAGTPALAIT